MHGLPIPGQQDLYVSIKQTELQRKGTTNSGGHVRNLLS